MLFAYNDILWPLIRTSNYARPLDKNDPLEQLQDDVKGLLQKLDPELANVWIAMLEFCTLINTAAETGGVKMSEQAFLHSMGSIMYRLLHQRFELGSLDEACRLGLLAFSSPVFLHWNRVELPDQKFTSTYRESLSKLDPMKTKIAPKESLWLLMIGALSMSYELDGFAWIEPRLQKDIEACGLLTWASVRESLNSFLWIGLVYDKPGEDIFNSI